MTSPKLTRRESTERLTALGLCWLWDRRKCRALADELGVYGVYSQTRLTRPMSALWRTDLAGMAERRVPGASQYRLDVVEVKGSRADLRREDLAVGKWALAQKLQGASFWLLLAEGIPLSDCEALPPCWGILQATENNTVVKTVRKPKAQDQWIDQGQAAPSLMALAYRAASSRLPGMGPTVTSSALAFHARIEGPEPDGFEELFEDATFLEEPAFQSRKVEETSEARPLDTARTWEIMAVLDDGTRGLTKGLQPGYQALVPVRGLDGRVIGAGQVQLTSDGALVLVGSIDYQTEERLLLETEPGFRLPPPLPDDLVPQS